MSKKNTLSDLNLRPWTPDRAIRAQEIGMAYPNLGKTGWERLRSTQVYPGATKDVMIFIHLSNIDDDSVETATFKEAKAFGVGRKLHLTDTAEFWEAYNKFFDVMTEIRESAVRPKDAGDEEEEPTDPK